MALELIADVFWECWLKDSDAKCKIKVRVSDEVSKEHQDVLSIYWYLKTLVRGIGTEVSIIPRSPYFDYIPLISTIHYMIHFK